MIPGAIVTIIAATSGTFGDEGALAVERGWPILLIAAGAWLLLRRRASS